MDFDFTDEQLALRDAVRGLLATTYASIDGRRTATAKDPGFDEDMWRRLAELGVLELPFTEDAGPTEVAIVATEIGRVVSPEPFVEAIVLAGGLLHTAGADTSGVGDGSVLPAYAGGPGVTARETDGGWVLDGVKEPVLNGARADLLVVTADVDGSTAIFSTTGGAAAGYATFDGGRAARVTFDGTPAELLARDAAPLVERAEAEARVAYSHESIGLMETALSLTTEYLRTRKQFGVPLKTFQTLTHRSADMYISLELARSTALWATLVLQDGGDATDAASRAKLQVSKAGRHVGKEAIQLHGGIGVTMEYSVGHYTMRLTAIDHLLGDGRHHLARLAAKVGDHGVFEPLP
ncbi:MAG TPA: acyl-CoA dehydrogenase family protein [Nocardioidaceae bacterium]|nr:acyl-CoA dehydrogenase family protein [Nocardioidaceae bacterium]